MARSRQAPRSQVGHFRYVCEHGTVHAACACPVPDHHRDDRPMTCPTPDKCRASSTT